MLYADFNFLEDNNIIYSVDMLRLKTELMKNLVILYIC